MTGDFRSAEGPDHARPGLSLVVPAYDDAAVLRGSLAAIARFVERRGGDVEVIVVDDGSTDGTAELVGRRAREVPWLSLVRFEQNHGKGYAVRAGVLRARGELVLFSDADLSTPLEDADRLVAAIEAGHDVAIGSRALPGSRLEVRQGPVRVVAGRVFAAAVRHIVIDGYRDTQCGFKLFRGEAARAVFERQRSHGFDFDVELLCIARELGLRVAEVPVAWRDHSASSHVRLGGDSVRMLAGLLSFRRRFGGPRASRRRT